MFFTGQSRGRLKIYGILHREDEHNSNLSGWVSHIDVDKYGVWRNFFKSNDSHGCTSEAIKAYEAIGYKRVEFLVVENTKESLIEFAKHINVLYGEEVDVKISNK